MNTGDWLKPTQQLPAVGEPIELIVRLGPAREAVILARLASATPPIRFESYATGELLPSRWEATYWRPAPAELLRQSAGEQLEQYRRLTGAA